MRVLAVLSIVEWAVVCRDSGCNLGNYIVGTCQDDAWMFELALEDLGSWIEGRCEQFLLRTEVVGEGVLCL